MKRIYLIAIILLFSTQLWASRWDYRLSKLHTYEVVRGNKKIYFLSEGGIFYFNKLDNSVVTLTKIDDLSGSDFSGMEYSYATNNLIVFYKNSMVDIVSEDDVVTPIPAIKSKNISGNKLIYNATCVGDLCYLSCGFGIVVLDIVNQQIKDTFIIGDNGGYEVVYDVAVDDQNIYAGTPNGIKYAPLDAPNLLDFSYWTREDNKFVQDGNYDFLEYGVGRVWAVHKSKEWHGDRIVSRHNKDTWYSEYTELEVVRSMNIQGDMITFCGRDAEDKNFVRVYQQNVGLVANIDRYSFSDPSVTPYGTDTIGIDPLGALVDETGIIWIADNNYGAVRLKDGVFDVINPGGPVDNSAFSLTFSNNKLWVAGGGVNSSWDNLYNRAVFQSYVSSEDRWEAFSVYNQPILKHNFDVVKVLPTPGDPNHIFVGTWGGGILEFKDGKYVTTFNENNSSLQNIRNGDYFLRIGGMDFDSKGNLWVSNSEVEKCLSVRRTNGDWESFSIPELAYSYKVGKVMVASDDKIWMIVPREKTKGLFVMRNDGQHQTMVDVTSYFSNGDDAPWIAPMNDVYDVVEDINGEIWVGTSKGATVFHSTDQIFTKVPFYADQPSLNENDGYYHPLLQTQTVTAIAVDGGNRKYLGTRNDGIYLVSADGTEEIEHYTAENSDLISDGIVNLEYDGKNGILYVGTDLGLVSLVTPSKQSFDHFTNVYAYPNPVRSTYEGDIYITGLMEDTNVKITTVSGQLVSEMTSVGGQASWDGRDLAGNRVHTGVYMVLCASKDGMESAITKILFFK